MPTLTALPPTLQAGDSYTITLTRADYPASAGWSLVLAIAGVDVRQWTSVASGDAHVLTLLASETAVLGAGLYTATLRATRVGAVETIARQPVEVLADVATFTPGEGVSYWQTLKTEAQNALTQIMAGGALQMGMIQGRQFQYRSPDDCLRVIAQCDARLAALRGAFGTPIRFDVVGLR